MRPEMYMSFCRKRLLVEYKNKNIFNVALTKAGTLKSLSDYTGLSVTTVAYLARGLNDPTINTMLLLADFIGIKYASVADYARLIKVAGYTGLRKQPKLELTPETKFVIGDRYASPYGLLTATNEEKIKTPCGEMTFISFKVWCGGRVEHRSS
jgi:transcriptional regulator with XRE-family HTH domain